jgi:hypothetical protein
VKKIFFACFLFAAACSDNKPGTVGNLTVFNQFPVTQNITFENAFAFDKGVGFGLFVSDSSIFISNIDGVKDYFFYQYDLKTKKMLGKYLNGGRSKGQAMSAYTFGLYKKRTVWAHDIPMNKVVTVPVKDSGKTASQQIHDYTFPDIYISVQLMDSSKLLTHGLRNRESPYKFQIVDCVTGKTVSEFGPVEGIPENVPVNIWKNAYAGFIFLKPEEDKFVLACRYADQIEIFDLPSKKNKIIKGPENYEAVFTSLPGKNDIQRTDKTRFAFIGGSATSKHIYLLYSGENHRTAKVNSAKFIYVYDWNGIPVRKISLDRYVSCFTVSEDEQTIYAFDPNTSFVLISKR